MPPKIELEVRSGEALAVFDLLSPFVEKAGYKWTKEGIDKKGDAFNAIKITITKNES